MRSIWSVFAVAAALICVSSSTTWAYSEVGDAGSLPGAAQGTSGSPLTSISGTIADGNDADMYQIFIGSPGTFSATTVGTGGTLADTQLFLFDASGLGIYANDDFVGLRSTLPAGDANSPTSSGVYYLVISGFNRDPVSAGGRIFPDTFVGVFGPTGPGGGSPISGYTGTGGTGTYTINLTGAEPSDVAAVPEPATLALVGSGLVGLLARRRLRRKSSV
jgi:PEP-CTERM motif